MTLEQILDLSGRDLDVAVAQHVMNWCQGRMGVNAGFWVDADGDETASVSAEWLRLPLWNPSSDGNAMLAVLDKLRSLGWGVSVHIVPQKHPVEIYITRAEPYAHEYACGDTLPEAACRAALLATMR